MKRSHHSFEREKLAQILEAGILQKKRPAGETGVYGAFQPRHRFVLVPQYGINAGDIIVGVMRMAEGTWRIQRLPDTL